MEKSLKDYVDRGSILLRRGDINQAIKTFTMALDLTNNQRTTALLHREIGVAHLQNAYSHSPDASRSISRAKEGFLTSQKTFANMNDLIEAAFSHSLYGQALLTESLLYDQSLIAQNVSRVDALNAMIEADETLSDQTDKEYNPQYELGNLLHLGRVLPMKERFANARRVKSLTKELDRPASWRKYIIIMIGGDNFYRRGLKKAG